MHLKKYRKKLQNYLLWHPLGGVIQVTFCWFWASRPQVVAKMPIKASKGSQKEPKGAQREPQVTKKDSPKHPKSCQKHPKCLESRMAKRLEHMMLITG